VDHRMDLRKCSFIVHCNGVDFLCLGRYLSVCVMSNVSSHDSPARAVPLPNSTALSTSKSDA
jgi:hypothetical protein